jgi:hypothetical protein
MQKFIYNIYSYILFIKLIKAIFTYAGELYYYHINFNILAFNFLN